MKVHRVHGVLGAAAVALAFPVVLAVVGLGKEPWLAVMAVPHAVAVVATVLGLMHSRLRWVAWACAVSGAAALAWALFLAGSGAVEILVIFTPGPALGLTGGVMLVRQNPKRQESPLPSIGLDAS